jgi:hypothetical protein
MMNSRSMKFENWIGVNLPPRPARLARRLGIYPRYWLGRYACRQGYKMYAQNYPQKVLFIAGLPKSGTTWVQTLLASYPGFHELLIPEASLYDIKQGRAHDYELPEDIFTRYNHLLVVSKVHSHGSLHNCNILHQAGVRYLVVYRDLRDVAVSEIFYLQHSSWHPLFAIYNGLPISEGLKLFARQKLLAYVDWIRTWHKNRDPEASLVLRYEDMLADPLKNLTRVADHFLLDSSPTRIASIIESNSFQRASRGRASGQEDRSSFYRKGVAGDWRNHFTPEITRLYKNLIGDFLIEYGYEPDDAW